MVEFMSGYMPAMDREFEERPVSPTMNIEADIEQPIIPIGEIGTTSPDAIGGNILQNLENNIKMGTKKIQIVFTPGRGGVSQGPASYGKEVRQSLFEKAKATGVELIGVELSPAMISGLAGYDQRSGAISEEKRQNDLKQVRDAIRFAADVSKGGGVDLWSQEFQRTIFDADWNKDEKNNKLFFDYSQEELKSKDKQDQFARTNLVKYLIDDRTGQPISGSQVRVGDSIQEIKPMTAKDYEEVYGERLIGKKDKTGRTLRPDDPVDFQGNFIDINDIDSWAKIMPRMNPETKQFDTQKVPWEKVIERTKEFNNRYGSRFGRELKPEEYLYIQKLNTQKTLLEGQSLHYSRGVDHLYMRLHELETLKKTSQDLEVNMNSEQRKEWIKSMILQRREEGIPYMERERLLNMKPSQVVEELMLDTNNAIKAQQEQAMSYKVQQAEMDEAKNHIRTPENFAKDRSIQSYAEMGLDAMNVTRERKLDNNPIYIGPEIGWAGQAYGGHPREFKELIEKSRKKMAEMLVNQQGYNPESAAEKAKTHIKGMLDTSHMAMWYKHFARKEGESDAKHLARFNEWMRKEATDLVKAGVVGSVQVVDSIDGEHSHLPAGQGVFDVANLVKAMKAAGFNGHIISEGHEEDTGGFGQGRILTEAWKAFGSPIRSVTPGRPMGLGSWGGIQHSYFGRTTPPNYIVGAYVPSNEWTLWSETPFE